MFWVSLTMNVYLLPFFDRIFSRTNGSAVWVHSADPVSLRTRLRFLGCHNLARVSRVLVASLVRTQPLRVFAFLVLPLGLGH